MDDSRPIFLQIATSIEDQILDGSLPEESQVPSINELAAFHRINPATALKGINLLVDANILYKRRGIGMFVSAGAAQTLRQARQSTFKHQWVRPLTAQARALDISPAQLCAMITEEMVS